MGDKTSLVYVAFTSQFCDFISLCCLVDLSGRVVLILLDYVNHVPICSHLRCILVYHFSRNRSIVL